LAPLPEKKVSIGSHIPALDGIRGIAILLVMLFHFVPSSGLTGVVGKTVSKLTRSGWAGVDLFFVLSGFLITGILWDTKRSPHFFRSFYLRRVLRIFPLYYAVLLVVFGGLVLLPSFRTPEVEEIVHQQGWLWTYCSNIPTAFCERYVFNEDQLRLGHFWSLAVEEHYYLLWPAVVFLFDRKSLMAICLGMILLALPCRLFLLQEGRPLAAWVLTPCRMDELAAGSFLALAARGPGGIRRLVPYAWLAGGMSGLVIVTIGLSSSVNGSGSGLGRYPVLACFFGALVLLGVAAGRRSVLGFTLNSRVLVFFGRYSYGLYVFHALLAPVFETFFPVPALSNMLHSTSLGILAYVVLAFCVSILAALVSWTILEKPFLQLKRYFEYTEPRSPGWAPPLGNG
jgi:peptidoglycan/LPS O-acetylase OafA/YrhL